MKVVTTHKVRVFQPGSFEAEDHWYEKALNATIHPMIQFFLTLDSQRVVDRYCHLHPRVDREFLQSILETNTKFFRWAGADLINVTTAGGNKQMIIIENNSCPSGQKSMPLAVEHKEQGGYRRLIEGTFKSMLDYKRGLVDGTLAVLYDKNPMETSGYAKVIADVFQEPVYFTPFFKDDPDPPARFSDGILEVRDDRGVWMPVRAAFRYVTQKPWARIPLHTKTRILNPIASCLAGGRNKMVAAKAYDLYNAEIQSFGLELNIPATIWDVSKNEVPLWINKMGGHAVVKVPYSNAGQGVYTIVNRSELNAFMQLDFEYDKFIIQCLIGNYHWSSKTSKGKFYHVGTIPNLKGRTYVFDLRMMIQSTEDGMRPICVYSRRAPNPLVETLETGVRSWDMLGTNLSSRQQDGTWTTDTSRLLMMDRRDFHKLGLGLDDLIEAYIQTILSTIAIDRMAEKMHNSKGRFRMKLFESLNNDPVLIKEILEGQ